MSSTYSSWSPYLYAGNNPISYIDFLGLGPETGLTVATAKTLSTATIYATRTLNTVTTATKIITTAAKLTINITAGVVDFMNTSGTINSTANKNVGGVNGDDGWQPFYKSDLIKYVITQTHVTPTENNLGEQFENIFENYMRSEFPIQTQVANFRRTPRIWYDSGIRNTKPDFVADDLYGLPYGGGEKIVKEGSAYEVKQNNGKGIYLSSNDDQIKGHILNLAARHADDISTGSYNPNFTLITTCDVRWSPGISAFAFEHGVAYYQRRALYKIVDGHYQFKFVGFGASAF